MKAGARADQLIRRLPPRPPCEDGLTIYVTTEPVQELTIAQMRDIYTGKIGN